MNQTSPAATGTAVTATAGLVAALAWVNNHYGLGLTAQDQVSIAGGIVAGIHWLAQQYATRGTVKNPVVTAQQ